MPLKPNPRRFFRFTCGGKYTEKDLDRYSSKVDTTPGLGPKGDCWEWRGSLIKSGYGHFHLMINDKETTIKAHRAAIEMATRILIPDGKVVMHKCDNHKCVKVFIHLILGTQKENVQDMISKGRGPERHGDKSGMAKLTWIKVAEIRKLYSTKKYSHRQLAKIFNVNHTIIGDIVRNETWYNPSYIPQESRLGRKSNCLVI